MKTLIRVTAAIAAVLLVLFITAGFILIQNIRPVEITDSDIFFTVEKAEYFGSIASRLERERLIRSSLIFRLYATLQGSTRKLQVGTYLVPSGSTIFQVHDILFEGKQHLEAVTVPEGIGYKQVAKIFADQGLSTMEELISAMEDTQLLSEFGIQASTAQGFLYPDTYNFPLSYPAEKIVEHLLSTFFTKLSEIVPDYQAYSWEELYSKVILASIVEREYRIEEEASLIASVFTNRLDIGMNLQSCATVVYVLTEEYGRDHPSRIYYRDLEVDSAYNTYIQPGLPPGPISNPGLTTLYAAFYPESTNYLYFALKDPATGESYFSSEYGDHLAAYELYIKEN
jgi:UPF0755 protein